MPHVSQTTISAFALITSTVTVLAAYWQSRRHGRLRQCLLGENHDLRLALDNMPQGLLLLDASGQIVVANSRYVGMYQLSPDVVKPGCGLARLVQHRQETGSFTGDPEAYTERVLATFKLPSTAVTTTADGRFIQIINRPLISGGAVLTHEDITERRRADAQIRRLAYFDTLTGLPNRAQFIDRLEMALASVSVEQRIAIHYLDLDQFKAVNDTLGHSVGDELLRQIGTRLQQCMHDGSFIARLGGDEFAVVQLRVTSQRKVIDLVQTLLDVIRAPSDCLGHRIAIDASIGIALASEGGTDLDQVLKKADLAMYAAKSAGRHTYRFFDPEMEAKLARRRSLENSLRKALNDGALEVHYQPCISLQDGRITCCEALARWQHPSLGYVSPAEFIPIAEEAGLIDQLGQWVLGIACAEATSWPDRIGLAINVSPTQFKNGRLADDILDTLASSGLPANRLEIEVTETILIRDDEAALAILSTLRANGVRIALDDFGTGYSALGYLRRFPFDKIKIDRCFVSDLHQSGGSPSIVRAVVSIASAFNITTTAEGVETESQRWRLQELGCSEMQGHLFSEAVAAEALRELLRATAVGSLASANAG